MFIAGPGKENGWLLLKNIELGASLVAQDLRTHLPKQGT